MPRTKILNGELVQLTSEEEKRHSKLEAIARIYFTTADMLILLIKYDY